MKKILLLLVVLFAGMVNGQTFEFSCGGPVVVDCNNANISVNYRYREGTDGNGRWAGKVEGAALTSLKSALGISGKIPSATEFILLHNGKEHAARAYLPFDSFVLFDSPTFDGSIHHGEDDTVEVPVSMIAGKTSADVNCINPEDYYIGGGNYTVNADAVFEHAGQQFIWVDKGIIDAIGSHPSYINIKGNPYKLSRAPWDDNTERYGYYDPSPDVITFSGQYPDNEVTLVYSCDPVSFDTNFLVIDNTNGNTTDIGIRTTERYDDYTGRVFEYKGVHHIVLKNLDGDPNPATESQPGTGLWAVPYRVAPAIINPDTDNLLTIAGLISGSVLNYLCGLPEELEERFATAGCEETDDRVKGVLSGAFGSDIVWELESEKLSSRGDYCLY